MIPERHIHEVHIRVKRQAADLTQQSPTEVVQTANIVLGSSEVVATHRLPSGDTILIFREDIPVEAIQKQEWVAKAFGLEAKLYASEFAVITKGLPVSLLYSTADTLILQEIKAVAPEAIRYRIEYRRDPTVRFTTCIIYLHNMEAAERLCNRGLV